MSSPGAGSSVDTLITAMILDASGYEAGAQKVIAADNAMIASFKRVTAAYKSMVSAMGTSAPGGGGGGFGGGNWTNFGGNTFNAGRGNFSPNFSNLGRGAFSGNSFALSFGGGGGGGGGMQGLAGTYLLLRGIREVEHALEMLGRKFIEFSGDALKEYSTFDTLQRSFIGVYGSAEKAAQMMNYLRDVAMVSAFQFRDLADASRSLSVAGLDVGRFLPIAQGFALAMGHINGAGLEDFISILRRIMGGNTGFALGPRGIGRYGVSRQELEQYGATFGGANQSHFTGSINQAFDAIEGVYKSRIAKIAESVTASSEVVLSNWKDSIKQATIDFGAGMAQNVIGPIKAVTSALNTLRQAGVIKNLADTVYQIIGLSDMLGDNSGRTGKLGKFDPSDPSGWMKGQDAAKYLVEIAGGIVTLVEFVKLEVEQLAAIGRLFFGDRMIGDPESVLSYALKAGEDFKQSAFMQMFLDASNREKHPERFKPPAPVGTGIPGVDEDALPEVKNHLKHIRDSSERIARHFDSRSTAFGGGDIGRMGVTPVELANYWSTSSKGTHGVKNAMSHMGEMIEQYIAQRIHQALSNAMRQGVIHGGAH